MSGVYLTFIGIANSLGALLLFAATRPEISDLMLRRWTRILPQDQAYPAAAGPSVWALWAAIGTAGFAWLNFRAREWGAPFASEVVRLDVFVYGAFEVAAIMGTASGRWGAGLWVAHPLWIGQAGWGVWVLQSSAALGM